MQGAALRPHNEQPRARGELPLHLSEYGRPCAPSPQAGPGGRQGSRAGTWDLRAAAAPRGPPCAQRCPQYQRGCDARGGGVPTAPRLQPSPDGAVRGGGRGQEGPGELGRGHHRPSTAAGGSGSTRPAGAGRQRRAPHGAK